MERMMLETRLLQRIQDKKEQLDKLRPLPTAAVRRLNEQLTIEWIYNSNAIEGSTLTLRETQLILEQGITIGGKSLREHFEVINHLEAIRLVESLARQQTPVSAFYVRQLHALLLAKIDDENAGQYRNLPVRIVGAAHEPPPAWDVSAQMDDWAVWLQEQEGQLEVEVVALILMTIESCLTCQCWKGKVGSSMSVVKDYAMERL
jgi:Fic family protein